MNELEKREKTRRLHKAAARGHWRVVAALVAEGVEFRELVYGHYSTPLHKAAEYGKPKVIDVLLDAGADVNSREHYYREPALSRVSDPRVAELLLARGADPVLKCGGGVTPLDHARNRFKAAVAAVIERHLLERESLPSPRASERGRRI